MTDPLVTRYPEFKDISQDRINLAKEDAAIMMCKRVWGKKYDSGIDALAAHYMWESGALDGSEGNGAGAQVATSKTAGALSVSYADPSATFEAGTNGLSLSKYGRRWLQLRNSLARHFLVVPKGGGMLSGTGCR